ncbi:hypothetical protein [Paucibacter sp. B51]|uniref:hypothetical protein n=1 Tax=Paucibacter sp. B51 TaxID=2993315 RepID=UPI0022EBE4B6|nr:hypothetical protein [Paucibacter sp. B51]
MDRSHESSPARPVHSRPWQHAVADAPAQTQDLVIAAVFDIPLVQAFTAAMRKEVDSCKLSAAAGM